MKRLMVIALVAVGLSVLAYGQTTSTSRTSGSQPRYQLVPTEIHLPAKGGGMTVLRTVLLVDTESGRVWRYAYTDAPEDSTAPPFPEHFDSIPVDGLRGWDTTEAMKRWIEALQKHKK